MDAAAVFRGLLCQLELHFMNPGSISVPVESCQDRMVI